MTSSSLEDVALRVAAALGQQDYILVGGLAVAAHGYVRATLDVDFVVRDVEAAREHLREQGLPIEVLRGEFTCIRGAVGDVRFDVLPPLVPIRWDQAITVSLGKGASIRVVDIESLVRLKLKAGGPKDLMDVAALVLRHPEQDERAREIALAYCVHDALDTWLRDPRLKSELAEARAAEGETRRRKARPGKPPPARRGKKARSASPAPARPGKKTPRN